MSDLYRVLSGEIAHKYLIVQSPKINDLVDAEEYASQVYDDNFERGAFTIEELCEDVSDQQDSIMKRLDSLKVEYYKTVVSATFDDPSRFLLRERIEETEEELCLLLTQNRKLEPFTCEGISAYAKSLFLLERTTVWSDSYNRYDWSRIGIIQLHDWISTKRLTEKDIRKIAKSREWRQIWNVKDSGQIFTSPLFLLSDEQRDLLFWSRLYDSANESADSPTEEVLEDDYAFDGWLIDKRQERVRENAQASREKFSKASQAQDVFLPVRSQRDLQTIQTLNSPEATGKKMQIFRKMNEDAKAQRTSGSDS